MNYTLIPNNIKTDNSLSGDVKMLYGDIKILCTQKGFCWATNGYFAKLYSKSKRTISRWIKKLVDHGYIKSQLIYKNGTKEIEQRKITLASVYTPMDKSGKEDKTSSDIGMYVDIYKKYKFVSPRLTNFLNKIQIDKVMTLELFETLVVETMNNDKAKNKEKFLIATVRNLFNAAIRTLADYDTYLDNRKPKKFIPNNNFKNNTKPFKSRFHNINESFRNYSPDELERLLKESQKGKF